MRTRVGERAIVRQLACKGGSARVPAVANWCVMFTTLESWKKKRTERLGNSRKSVALEMLSSLKNEAIVTIG